MKSVKLSAGAKSTEFWLVLFFVLDFLMQRFGVYSSLSPEQIADAAGQVQKIAEQLRGQTGNQTDLVYLLGGLYVGGRTLVKSLSVAKGA